MLSSISESVVDVQAETPVRKVGVVAGDWGLYDDFEVTWNPGTAASPRRADDTGCIQSLDPEKQWGRRTPPSGWASRRAPRSAP